MPVSRHIRLRRYGALIADRVGVLVGAAISLRSLEVRLLARLVTFWWSFLALFGLR